MIAPITAIFGLPLASKRVANARKMGLARCATTAGKYKALRAAAFPTLLSRVLHKHCCRFGVGADLIQRRPQLAVRSGTGPTAGLPPRV